MSEDCPHQISPLPTSTKRRRSVLPSDEEGSLNVYQRLDSPLAFSYEKCDLYVPTSLIFDTQAL